MSNSEKKSMHFAFSACLFKVSPPLSGKNQKCANPPHPLSEMIFCHTPTNEVKPTLQEEILWTAPYVCGNISAYQPSATISARKMGACGCGNFNQPGEYQHRYQPRRIWGLTPIGNEWVASIGATTPQHSSEYSLLPKKASLCWALNIALQGFWFLILRGDNSCRKIYRFFFTGVFFDVWEFF